MEEEKKKEAVPLKKWFAKKEYLYLLYGKPKFLSRRFQFHLYFFFQRIKNGLQKKKNIKS